MECQLTNKMIIAVILSVISIYTITVKLCHVFSRPDCNNNKQLFLNEIVFRFRKDIGSLRRSGVVIILHEKYWGVGDLWSHVSVITENKYFPFTLPQGRGYSLISAIQV